MFGFPLLLALGLGIAFRNKPADVSSIAIVAGPGAQQALTLIQRSPQKARSGRMYWMRRGSVKGFRIGKYDLVIEPTPGRIQVPLRSGASGERAGACRGGRCVAGGVRTQGRFTTSGRDVQRAGLALH